MRLCRIVNEAMFLWQLRSYGMESAKQPSLSENGQIRLNVGNNQFGAFDPIPIWVVVHKYVQVTFVRTGHVWQLNLWRISHWLFFKKLWKTTLENYISFRNYFFPDLCIDMDMGSAKRWAPSDYFILWFNNLKV